MGWGSYYLARIVLGHSAPSLSTFFPTPDVIFYVKILNDDEFISPLLKYFIGFLLRCWFLDFSDFEYLERHQIVFYISSEAKEGTNYELRMVIAQIRTSER